MKVPEWANESLKIAGGVSACAGGVIAVITAIAGAVKSSKARQEIADLIVGEILEKHSDLTSTDVKSVVRTELKSSDYWKSLDFCEKGMVTEMVTKDLLKKVSRKEAVTC